MTALLSNARASPGPSRLLFAATVFLSAGLTFLVQPMIARMLLPLLGGSPAVWNTSMAFFQGALLLGYAYAHGLQRLKSVRGQIVVHVLVLLAAAVFLPVRVPEVMGPPQSDAPVLWLLGALSLSVGAPFAALAATAPLVQAWYARREGAGPDAASPYVLYAASNLGSLLGLLAYPAAVEPLLALPQQAWLWTGGFGLFGALLLLLGARMWGASPTRPLESFGETRSPVAWRDRLAWVGLAAIPSSLLLGVTSHLTTDVAAAPFLWAAPLGLYLITFIIAFQSKPLIGRDRALFWHAGLVPLAIALLLARSNNLPALLGVGLSAFFVSALVCHQALAARKPPPDRLTEFYLCLSLGGVLGGAFNAFLAPVLFDSVWEYPLALVLTALARPWRPARLTPLRALALGIGAAALAGAVVQLQSNGGSVRFLQLLVVVGVACAFLVRDRTWAFALLLAAMASQTHTPLPGSRRLADERGFFGTLRVDLRQDPRLGPTHALYHGTTLHGTQALRPEHRCRPLSYYAPVTPIGQTFAFVHRRQEASTLGVVGLGAGAVASYVRPTDRLRFYEIDPLVVRFARDRRYFTYISDCAQGAVDVRLGDARLTLQREPAGVYDLLLLDAFSSDSVPTHLLTLEAMRMYLARLKPDGLLVLHLSNRHLDLQGTAVATVRAAGGAALLQNYRRQAAGNEGAGTNASQVLVASSSPAVLDALASDPRWTRPSGSPERPWTDSYVNIAGALIEGAR